ncbi:transmembrane protease serine 9-like [Penaeus japonicus]|uniref:transmembrane protease serine 9-like n=1 Tax=Penaeus japonicus TaxID=27405 RepID=UPI001C70BA1D|nr:transmembrane protease serine 9-like [Penaeus japonicus]
MFLARLSGLCLLLLILPLASFGIPSPRHDARRTPTRHHLTGPEDSRQFSIARNKCPRCGKRSDGEEDRIVGGKDAGDFPWMAGVLVNGGDLICGASLITGQYLLTAAYCVGSINLEEDSIEVLLGTKFLRKGTEESRQRIRIVKVIVHEKHHPMTLAHNIALLKLEEPADLSSKVAPICLNMEDVMDTTTTAIATGWGRLGEDGNVTETLQEVKLPVVPQEECGKQYLMQTMPEDVVCAGAEGKGTCQFDTGGSLVVPGLEGSWHLLGITSWGWGCGRANYSGVFVRVPSYLSWIAGKISEDDCAYLSHLSTPPLPLPSKPNNNCKCGVANLADRIVGGYVTKPHTYPWQVALVERLKMIPYCGGALVSDLWVLTSCTCTLWMVLGDEVILGMHDWSKDNEVGRVRRNITEIVMHPGYGLAALDNDIALLKLSSPVPLDQVYIAPVCLPALGQKFDRGVAVVTGWGSVEFGGKSSEELRAVEVPIQRHRKCSRRYSSLTKNMICTDTKGGKDACQGDSGGPLVMDNGRGNYELIGIVSWVLKCDHPRKPRVYVNVANYVEWISDIIVDSETCAAR